MSTLDNDLVLELHRLRNRFGRDAAREKSRVLAQCAERTLTGPRVALRYHEVLLFLAAHPDDARIRGQVDAELRRVAEAVPRWRTGLTLLDNCGLPHTIVENNFSIDLVDWLVDRHPGAVEVAWQDGSVGELGEFVGNLVLPVERDGQFSRGHATQEWVRFASAGTPEVSWITRGLRRTGPAPAVLDALFDGLDVPVCWRIDERSSRTFLRMPCDRIFHQRSPLKRAFSMPRLLGRPLPKPLPLTERAATELIDVARATLAVRSRETDPVTYANPKEVTRFSLDRGVGIALFGLKPERRLPIESYVGYVAARNGVPAAYGGAWIFGHRAEIGVHLFEALRGGESTYLFGQVLRTYRQHFDVRRFLIDPFQFGADNPDAIKSGAFWFYHRLGFRPVDEKLRAVAAEEHARIRADRAYRTPAVVLRRFTKAPLAMDLPGSDPDDHPPKLPRIGLAVTAAIRDRFGGDREVAGDWARRRVARLLRPGRRSSWPAAEQRAVAQLGPLVALLPGVDAWPASDRRALLKLMRAKGGVRERDYVRAVQRHARLRAALRELVVSVD